MPYGIVKKAHEDEKKVYPEITIDRIKYFFLKEIAKRQRFRRWGDKCVNNPVSLTFWVG
jgi:hypothetical protein